MLVNEVILGEFFSRRKFKKGEEVAFSEQPNKCIGTVEQEYFKPEHVVMVIPSESMRNQWGVKPKRMLAGQLVKLGEYPTKPKPPNVRKKNPFDLMIGNMMSNHDRKTQYASGGSSRLRSVKAMA